MTSPEMSVTITLNSEVTTAPHIVTCHHASDGALRRELDGTRPLGQKYASSHKKAALGLWPQPQVAIRRKVGPKKFYLPFETMRTRCSALNVTPPQPLRRVKSLVPPQPLVTHPPGSVGSRRSQLAAVDAQDCVSETT